MTTRYQLAPGQGRFTVQAFATGILSVLGHSPKFAVHDYAGGVQLDGPGIEGLSVALTVRADSLDLLDRVSATDRAEIERRMRQEVLETEAFPEIGFHTVETSCEPAGPGRYRAFLGGRLTLHGQTQPLGTDAELAIDSDHIRIRGGCPLRMSAFRLRPVTALAGAIKLRDELRVAFDLVALAEGH